MTLSYGYIPSVIAARGGIRATGSGVVYLDAGDFGPTEIAEIQPALDAAGAAAASSGVQQRVVLGAGVFQLPAPIRVPSGVDFVGQGIGVTILEPAASLAPTVGAADDPNNALVLLVGVLDPLELGLSAVHPKDSRSLALNVAPPAGTTFIALQGHNQVATEQYLISSGGIVDLGEIVPVLSVAGLNVTLDAPTTVHHTAASEPATVQRTTRKVTPIERVSVVGMTLRAPGRTIANGIRAQYVSELHVDIAGQGFSRAIADVRCSRSVSGNVRSEGEVNCYWLLDAVSDSTVTLSSSGRGKRFHANGLIRGAIEVVNRCTNVTAEGFSARTALGWRYIGGVNLGWGVCLVKDVDWTESLARDAAGLMIAAGFQCGTGPVGLNENAIGVVVDSMVTSNVRGPNTTLPSIYWHDTAHYQVGEGRCVDDGLSPSTAGLFATGMQYQDVDGVFALVACQGVHDAHVFSGGQINLAIASLSARSTPGYGVIASTALDFDYRNDTGGFVSNGPRIAEATIENYSVPVSFNAFGLNDWLVWPDMGLRIGSLSIDNLVITDAMAYYNETGGAVVAGEIAKIGWDAALAAGVGARAATLPAAGDRGLAVVASPAANNAYMLAGALPAAHAMVMGAAAAIASGARLQVDGAKNAITLAAGVAFGTALETKGAGARLIHVGIGTA